ncbi:hypothetical protein HKX54_10770 [Sulfitobacter sp. M57]|uniref:hypothetical protein n=1 Tax=unclassified Sulfitobacter TaxID=196795 RepID=UPI0023E32668|nr:MULTISPECIES: hypothetical protein [unclassified Sulfitobacter]MDF3414937.1 hypothetical protein [Sulfitobacter sp. KE5]MDF3422418.1 hypothetical protein [Sulfitobacter sp. KE43]MDF3433483.1 hypothetical protein [Sulfitobacter sp. KE42]MDF3459123.1 hypothetical protein [Sulfitobacter sp. S74]MDF3463022.1 hypothetical protein [Sulfitobacter sp. Ks18]
MLRTKEILTAIGALGCAIGIGFIMQNSESAQAFYGPTEIERPEELPELRGASAANALLNVQEIKLTSAEFDTSPNLPQPESEVVTVSTPSSVSDAPETYGSIEVTPAPLCEIAASARPVAAAMVDLNMQAPCLPNERVTVHHNGMIFTVTTSDQGELSLRVPALAQEAVFILAFTSGEGAVAQTTVEELADFDRSVLQWKGNTGFQIHAREFGADYGSTGHLWDGAPGEIADAVSGNGGVLTRHGDMNAADPLLAEVYSFPKAHNARSGKIALSVETEVTDANCGLEIEAQSLEIQPDGGVKTQNLILPVPDCDAEGSFLVLNNLLQDLKVAGR